jgi:hypothetical protein
MTPSAGKAADERRVGDRPSQLDSCAEPALCCLDITEAAMRARACHPAYAARIRFPIRPPETSGPIENW